MPALDVRLSGNAPIYQRLDFRKDFWSQVGRNSPIIKYPAIFSMLAAGHENTRSISLFQARGQPAYESAVIRAERKVETEHPKQFLCHVITGNQLTPNDIISD